MTLFLNVFYDAGVKNNYAVFFQMFVSISTIGLYDLSFLSICLYDIVISLGLYDTEISKGLYDVEVSLGLYDRSFDVF